MQDKIISIFQTSTVCASKETNSVEMVEIVKKLSSFREGKEYMQNYLTLFNYLDQLSGSMFPYRSSDIGARLKIKEITKYYDAYRQYLDDENIPRNRR